MTPSGHSVPWLVADIGGTNLRAAVCDGPGTALRDVRSLTCAEYPDIAAALAACLEGLPVRPRSACLAVAGPVTGDAFRFSNSPWAFSTDALARRLGFEHLRLVNDFEALAAALPSLTPAELVPLGGGPARPGGAMAVLGPGTGLGVAALAGPPGRRVVIPGEGGNIGFSPQDELERDLLGVLARQGARVTNEMILSGPGLARLYAALATCRGVARQCDEPAAIVAAGLAGTDALAVETLDVFCAVLGAVAGDVALVFGATGGVYLGGGIVPRLLPLLPRSRFRQRFEDKLAQRDYVAAMPVRVITAEAPALRGALARLGG